MRESEFPHRPGPGQYKNGIMEDNMLFEIDFERFIQENLGFRELLVSQMLVSGYTVADIARYQGVSRRYITRVVTNLREKFREFLGRLLL